MTLLRKNTHTKICPCEELDETRYQKWNLLEKIEEFRAYEKRLEALRQFADAVLRFLWYTEEYDPSYLRGLAAACHAAGLSKEAEGLWRLANAERKGSVKDERDDWHHPGA